MNMRISAIAAAAALMLGAGAAHAQNDMRPNGLYLGGMVGLNYIEDNTYEGGGTAFEGTYHEDPAGAAVIGWAYPQNFRTELELGFRDNDVESMGGAGADGTYNSTTLMANVLYDFPKINFLQPYIGVGLGVARMDLESTAPGGGTMSGDGYQFAWQGIAGAAMQLNDQLFLTADYRYMGTEKQTYSLSTGGSVESGYDSHAVMVGLRWHFNAPPKPMPVQAAEPAPAPAPAPAPEPEATPIPRTFTVFFDWDSAELRPDARRVLEAAAAAAKKGNFTRLDLTGHADRSGPTTYNMRLSLRRAEAVKQALIGLGLASGEIGLTGKGEAEPLVPTADGVREPRNRRVEIAF